MSAYRDRLQGVPAWGRCGVMGVVDVTPGSFSEDRSGLDVDRAVAHGLDLVGQGADIVDVGAESTRPGDVRIPRDEEMRRVLPVVRALAEGGALVSVDTMRADVAEAAVDAGARMINDVSGGQADPGMAKVVAGSGVAFVLLHRRARSGAVEGGAVSGGAVSEAVAEAEQQMDALVAAEVDPAQLIIDPGLGIATRTRADDWALLAGLDAWRRLGRPLLIAASRKRFLGTLLADPTTGDPRPPRARDAATAAVSAIAAAQGAWAVRVHEVRATADAVRVEAAIRAARTPEADAGR
ncbi:dihydropteroate synthase [Streptomyces sp. NPDC094038]|uniref:dihydropteroate synthase n=1 Tax=Streptomyces sp. NPDC094038 TaxID=3366055 RepID=UPI00380D47A2